MNVNVEDDLICFLLPPSVKSFITFLSKVKLLLIAQILALSGACILALTRSFRNRLKFHIIWTSQHSFVESDQNLKEKFLTMLYSPLKWFPWSILTFASWYALQCIWIFFNFYLLMSGIFIVETASLNNVLYILVVLFWINAKFAAALVLIWEILPSVVKTINFLLAFSGYALLVLGSPFLC